MTGVHSTVVVRNRASTLHNLLQHAASSMEPDLNRGEGQSQKIGDLRRSLGVGPVQQSYGAVLIGQEIQTSLHACACSLPIRNLERRGRFRNGRLNAKLALVIVQ